MALDKDLVIRLKAIDQGLNSQLKTVNQELRGSASVLRSIKAQQNVGIKVSGMDKIKILNTQINELTNKISILNQKRRIAIESGASTAEIKKLDTAINFANADLKRLSSQKVQLQADGTKLASFNNALTTTSNRIKSVSSVATNAGKNLTMMTAPAIAALGKFATESIKKASDVGESLNVIGITMGKNNVEEITKFAETSAKALGLSKVQALEAASSVGRLATGFGLSQDKAAAWAKDLTTRGADLGSAFNMSFDEVQTSLNSVFSGEAEPVKKLGLDFTETGLKAEASAEGIKKGVREMTALEKTQLRYNLLMRNTQKYAGDFANTLPTSYPNLIKEIGAEFSNLQIKLGEKLLPTAINVLKGIEVALQNVKAQDVIDFFTRLKDNFMNLKDSLEPFIAIATGMFTKIFGGDDEQNKAQGMADKITALILAGPGLALFGKTLEAVAATIKIISTVSNWEWVQSLAKTAWTSISAGFTALGGGMDLAAIGAGALDIALAPITLTIAAIAAAAALLYFAWTNDWGGIQEKTKAVVDAIGNFMNSAINFIKTSWNGLVGFFTSLWEGIKAIWSGAVNFFASLWGGIKTGVSIAWNFISGIITGAWKNFIKPTWDLVSSYFNMLWQVISGIFRLAWTVIEGIAINAWRKVIKPVWDGVSGFFVGLWEGIKKGVSSAWNFITGVFTGAWNNIIKPVWNGVSGFFIGLWEGIKKGVSSAWNFITGVFTGAWNNAIKPVWNGVSGFFIGLWEGIKKGVSSVWNYISQTFTGAWTNVIKPVWNSVGNFFSNLWTGISNSFSNALDWIWELPGKITNMFNRLSNSIKNFFKGAAGKVASFFGFASGGWVGESGIIRVNEHGQEYIQRRGETRAVPLVGNYAFAERGDKILNATTSQRRYGEDPTSTGNTSITFNITGNNPKEIAAMIERMLRDKGIK